MPAGVMGGEDARLYWVEAVACLVAVQGLLEGTGKQLSDHSVMQESPATLTSWRSFCHPLLRHKTTRPRACIAATTLKSWHS